MTSTTNMGSRGNQFQDRKPHPMSAMVPRPCDITISTMFIDADTMTADDNQAVGKWLADPERPKVLHEMGGPLLALAAAGWDVAGLSCFFTWAAW